MSTEFDFHGPLDDYEIELLDAAKERLDWLRSEYGEGDIDYLTFRPIVALLEDATRP